MAIAGMRTVGPGCCCEDCTVYFTDWGEWDAQDLNGPYDIWSFEPDQSGDTPPHHVWEIVVSGSVHFLEGRKSATSGSGPWRAIYHSTLPRHLSVISHVEAGEECVFNITYQAVNGADAKRVKMQVGLSGPSSDPGEHCGYLRLWDVTDLFSPVPLTDPVPVAGLVSNKTHVYRVCYDPETEVLLGSVTLFGTGAVHDVHADGLPREVRRLPHRPGLLRRVHGNRHGPRRRMAGLSRPEPRRYAHPLVGSHRRLHAGYGEREPDDRPVRAVLRDDQDDRRDHREPDADHPERWRGRLGRVRVRAP